jgi:hypothetical protein
MVTKHLQLFCQHARLNLRELGLAERGDSRQLV